MSKQSDAALQAQYEAHMADIAATEHAQAAGRRPVPFAGMDKSGMPPRADLARTERRALLGVAPRKSMWPELDRLDQRTAELQRRHAEAQATVRNLMEQRANAPQADADALARWEIDGRRGTKPDPSVPTLDARIADAERDRDGLEKAIDLVLEEKSAFVEKHRDRLANVASQQAEAAHQRMRALVDELETTRAGLVEARAAEVWARLYPANTAMLEPTTRHVAGNLAKPVRDTLGIEVQIEAARLLELLRRDADWLLTAATPEQRVELHGHDAPKGAVWAASDEHKQQRLSEFEMWRQAFVAEWGREPTEMQLEAFIRERGDTRAV